MGAHEWAMREIQQSVLRADEQGFAPEMALRALLSAVIERNRLARSAVDLAAELQFLADNLDDERDYSFMRP